MLQFCTPLGSPAPGQSPELPHRPRAVPAAHELDVAEARLRTAGTLAMALLLQGPENAAPANTGTALLEILANSSTISKAVLLILAAFSIAS